MKATAQQYATAWLELLQSSPPEQWEGISKKMLKQIHIDGRLGDITEITRLVEEQIDKQNGTTRVSVTLAHEMTEDQVREQVKTVIPDADEITVELDPEILGGMQIETTNTRWDLSLRGQLRGLANKIKS